MNFLKAVMTSKFSTTISINSDAATIWASLTNPELMTKWMGEPEMKIEIETDWKVNSPIAIRGFHHVEFENKGIILQYDKEKKLSYSHLSSISRLEDKTRELFNSRIHVKTVGKVHSINSGH